jgi:catechol 2,3-dioxygenase-like lactoylglutathione lyase family enzyme
MAIIKVRDVEYVRFTAPDLGRMREFLLDFGMTEAEGSSAGELRMRGTGDSPALHRTTVGPPGFAGLALRAASIRDLETLAKSERVAVEASSDPEGGSVVRLVDPNGYRVEVLAGQRRAPRGVAATRDGWNTSFAKARPNRTKRVAAGPSSVLRLGHVVLGVNDVGASWQWWHERFGLLLSDEVRAPDGGLAAVFIRCDRGSEPADHHTLNFAQIPGKPPAFHHAAFEVTDVDDLMVGHQLLKERGYKHSWGVGRHVLGSQVFDYWRDPWGNLIEHWTDGDLFAADVPASVADLPTMLGRQWGPPTPPDFV